MSTTADPRDAGMAGGEADAAMSLCRVMAAHGLPARPASGPRPDRGTVTDTALRTIIGHRLTGHLALMVARGDLTVDHDVRAAIETLHTRMLHRALQLEALLLSVVTLFRRRGIECRVLKGPVLARTVYPDPQVRPFVDIDVLVRGDQFDAATAVLSEAGHRRVLPELRAGFDRRFAKTAMFTDAAGCQIDLHRSLVVGPYGVMIDLDDLFATRRDVDMGGWSVPALSNNEQLVHICYHAALGDVPPRLGSLRDVAQILLHTHIDTDAVLALAARWNGLAVVARAVRLTWSELRLTADHPLAAWAQAYPIGWWDRQLLAAYLSERRSNSRKYLMTAMTIHGVSAKAAYLRALLFPDARFLHERAVARRAWWTHGAAALLRRVTPNRPSAGAP